MYVQKLKGILDGGRKLPFPDGGPTGYYLTVEQGNEITDLVYA